MSQYIHEIVLQEYIIENIESLELTVQYKNVSRMKLITARPNLNPNETFWDLEGKLENGIWIPIEVEWISSNFFLHKHHKKPSFRKFKENDGTIIVLRRNQEIPHIQQISLLDNRTEAWFKQDFTK